MLLHSLQWIRHQFNEVITDPSCEFMLTVCSQSHGPSTVNSPQSFQPGLPANKPVTGRLGAATLGHRRQTVPAWVSSWFFHRRRALVYPQPSTPLLGASQPRAMLFHLPGAVTSGMREAQMGSGGLAGAWVGWLPFWRQANDGKGGTGWKWSPSSSCNRVGCRARRAWAWWEQFTGWRQKGNCIVTGKHPPPTEMCIPGLVLGKETSLGRCGHQEGYVPKDVVPREETFPSRCPQEADVFGKEMSLGRCPPLEGNIPSEDVPSKVTPGR